MSANVFAKFRCAALYLKKALRIFRELITTTMSKRTTRVAFWDPPSGSKNTDLSVILLTTRWQVWQLQRDVICSCTVAELMLLQAQALQTKLNGVKTLPVQPSPANLTTSASTSSSHLLSVNPSTAVTSCQERHPQQQQQQQQQHPQLMTKEHSTPTG